MLFSRYSQPMRLIDGFVRIGNLCGFIDGFINSVNESQAWEFWLHRETGRSWEDFRLSVVSQDADTELLEKACEDVSKTFMEGVSFGNGTV